MAQPYQAILLIAFGGPTSPEEVRSFLARATKGMPIPPERLEEVAHHYEAVGGKSPLNEITFRQARALQSLLKESNRNLPVYVGMRNASPFFSETLQQMTEDGVKRALGFILSAHQTEASWERYQKNIADARSELGENAPAVDYCDGWHEHRLFIQTWVELIQTALAKIPPARLDATHLLFTAHSIPTRMAAQSPYVAQIETSAKLIAEKLHHQRWAIAYQSRSGRPTDPWLEPDIGQAIRDCAAHGDKQVVIAPIGFVCDHVEVLYDLDIEAKKIAADSSIEMSRTSCPNDHPTFIQMLAQVIDDKLSGTENRG